MHVEALDFCARAAKRIGPVDRAIEFGARDINGSARGYWPGTHWTGLDLAPGPNVDLVQDAAAPVDGHWDLALSTEMLEHCTDPKAAVARMAECADWVLITCATDDRAPHSMHDGGPLQPGEHYQNIDPLDLDHSGLEVVLAEMHTERGDLYLLSRRIHGND